MSRAQYATTSSDNVLQQPLEPTKSVSDLLSISQAPTNINNSQLSSSVIHQNTLCGEPLVPIEEDRELKLGKHLATSMILQNTECSDSSSSSKLRHKSAGPQIDPRLINTSDGLSLQNSSINTSSSWNAYNKRGNTTNWQERYPQTNVLDQFGSDTHRSQAFPGGAFRGQSKRNITSASYAYHTSNEAFSSNFYPVSKQNSEVHSQSSGALGGGDTTDDNYSTFTDPSPYQANDGRSGRPSKSSSDIRMQSNLVILVLKLFILSFEVTNEFKNEMLSIFC